MIGHSIRLLTRCKWLPHAEDLNPTLWRMYISTEVSSKFSLPGTLEPLKRLEDYSTDISDDVTDQSEKTEQSNPTGAHEAKSNVAILITESP